MWHAAGSGKESHEARKSEVMKVIFACGGTGGHIFPAVAVIEALRRRAAGVDPLFVLGKGGRGSAHLDRSAVRWETIPVGGMPRRNPLALIGFLAGVAAGVLGALRLIRRLKPAVVVAMGGYTSTPVAFAGFLARVPVFAAEQNMEPGVATKWNARFARRIFLAYDDARRALPPGRSYTVTGNPVRTAILEGNRARGMKRWDLKDGTPTVLITGGSQGARTMNRIVREMLERWERPGEVQFLFQTGDADYEPIRESCSRIDRTVRVAPFLADMGDAYGVADLVVCRAGASTLSEITALGLPAVLIPLPWAAANHQEKNARRMAAHGAAVTLDQETLRPETLAEVITSLLADGKRRSEMAERSRRLGRPEAAEKIADSILALCGGDREGEGRDGIATGGAGRAGG